MTGKTLGHYRIFEELGRGAMGQVHLAEDLRLRRRVALKMLSPELVADPVRRRRFERESKTLAALNHPNIVTLHAIEEEDGQPFLVMEYIEGTSLDKLIPPGGLPLERWLDLALPMVEGVAAAHRAGIVHRDLKPANVMVRSDGVVKVVDFGISKTEPRTILEGGVTTLTEFHTAPGIAVGTLPYMSPQQLEGRWVDARSDIFSLGVILYEMATGHRPFQGASSASLISSILRDPPLPLPRTAPLPAGMSTLLDRCLAKEPDSRFQTAGELRDALLELRRQALLGTAAPATAPAMASLDLPTLLEIPTTPSVTTSAAPEAEAPRRKIPWWLVGVGAALLLALGLALGFSRFRASPPAPEEAAVAETAAVPAKPDQVTSLAVLPLRNLSGDPEQDYFSDGTTEAIIANLAKIGGLRVSSRTSVMRFKEAAESLPRIAQELGVAYIVEGSVARMGDRVRVNVQLVEAAADVIVWTQTYERRLEDIFIVQSEVAEAVARETRGELPSADLEKLAQVRQVRPDVYELYLKARYLLSQRSQKSAVEALGLLDQALAKDPDYALAWAAKADCYVLLVSFGMATMPTREGIPKAREAALQALELDSTLSEAHALLGVIEIGSWNWSGAEERFRRAIELNPSNADAYLRYTQLLTVRGDHSQAIAAVQKALQLDPLAPTTHTTAAANYYFAGRYEDCLAAAQSVLELQPGSWAAHLFLGAGHARLGHSQQAEANLRQAVQLSRDNPFALGALGAYLARTGKQEEARRILAELESRSKSEYVAASLPGKIHFLLGEPDQGFAWMEKALAERDQSLNFLRVDLDYASVRSDPRFRKLLEQVGLTGR